MVYILHAICDPLMGDGPFHSSRTRAIKSMNVIMMERWYDLIEFNYPNKEMRGNYLKALEFRYPEWIPCSINISPAAWKRHREGLEEVIARHPSIFGQYEGGSRDFDEMPPVYRIGEYADNWGCVWYNIQEGIEGQVV